MGATVYVRGGSYHLLPNDVDVTVSGTSSTLGCRSYGLPFSPLRDSANLISIDVNKVHSFTSISGCTWTASAVPGEVSGAIHDDAVDNLTCAGAPTATFTTVNKSLIITANSIAIGSDTPVWPRTIQTSRPYMAILSIRAAHTVVGSCGTSQVYLFYSLKEIQHPQDIFCTTFENQLTDRLFACGGTQNAIVWDLTTDGTATIAPNC